MRSRSTGFVWDIQFGSGLKLLTNSRGQSLVQILISVAIMGIMMMAFASITSNQSRETAALSQKLAAMDLEKLLISSLADGSVCQYVLNNPKQTFNSQSLPATITLAGPGVTPATLYTNIVSGTPPTPGGIAAQVGSLASPVSNSLTVSSIQLNILSGSSGNYVGNWVVNFNSANLIRALSPVSVSTTLQVDDTTLPTKATITSCGGSASKGAPTCSVVPGSMSGPYSSASVNCPPKTTMVGGGCLFNAMGTPIYAGKNMPSSVNTWSCQYGYDPVQAYAICCQF